MSVLNPIGPQDFGALTRAALFPSAACVPFYRMGVSSNRVVEDFVANSLGAWRVEGDEQVAFVRVAQTQFPLNGTARLDVLFAADDGADHRSSPFHDLGFASTVISALFDALPLTKMIWRAPWTAAPANTGRSSGLIAASAAVGILPYHRWRDGSLGTEQLRSFSRDGQDRNDDARFEDLPMRAAGTPTMPHASALPPLPDGLTARLSGHRVGVRELRRSDLPWCHDLVAHDPEMRRWFFGGEHPTEEAFMQRVIGGLRYVSLLVGRRDEQPLGLIGCHDVDWFSGHCSVAVILDPSVRGAGWPLEGVVRYVMYLAHEAPLVKVYFDVRNADAASGASAGFDRLLDLEAELEYVEGAHSRVQRTYALYRTDLGSLADRLL